MKKIERRKKQKNRKRAESTESLKRMESRKHQKHKMLQHQRLLLGTLSLCMAFFLSCGLFLPHVVQAAPKNHVIEIHTAEDFVDFANHCFLDAWSVDKRVVLKEDIDLSGAAFEAVPVFAGTFDGQGHTIRGFSYSGEGYVAGLFRYIAKSGRVKNLKLQGEVLASDEKECIGSLCGVNYGKIKNCSFQGTVSGKTTVGGLCGVNEGTGILQGCLVKGQVMGYDSTGGMVGKNHGTVNHCTNRAGVNHSSAWVEEADEMDAGLLARLNAGGADLKLFNGVDCGGIAGCSDGTIIQCVNGGEVGYEHTGYNIGGIAGRQSGVVSLCENKGTVYGRSDVGGIIGQMEPYIEVNEAETLQSAVNKLHGLIAKTAEDMQDAKNSLKKDVDALAVYSDGAVDAGNALAGQMADLVDDSLTQAQMAADRLGHTVDMLSGVFDGAALAEDYFLKANQSIGHIGSRLEDLGDSLDALNGGGGLYSDVNRLEEAMQRVNAILQEMQNDSDVSGYFKKLQDALAGLSDAVAAVTSRVRTAIEAAGRQASDSFHALEADLNRLSGAMQRVNAILAQMQKDADVSVGQLKELQDALHALSDAFDAAKSSLKKALASAGGQAADSFKDAGDSLEKAAKALQRVNEILQQMQENPEEAAAHLKELKTALTELSDAMAAAVDSLKKALASTGGQATDSFKQALEGDLKKLEDAQQRLKTALQKLQEIQKNPDASTDRLKELQKSLTELSGTVTAVLNSLKTAIGGAGWQVSDSFGAIGDALDRLEAAQQRLKDAIKEIQNSPNVSAARIEGLQKALAQLSDALATAAGILNETAGDAGKQATDSLSGTGKDLTQAAGYLQQALDAIKTATKDVGSILDYVGGQGDIRFSKLGNSFDANREDLRAQLAGVSGCIKSLGNHASSYSDVVNEDFQAVNDQITVIFNLLADSLSDYEKISMEGLYEDVDAEDTGSITAGKADNCTNKGTVKGDTHVGGIAGAMAIDEEDLTGNAAGSVEYQIGRKFFTKCLIANCTNDGYVAAKKDGAGGIVGYMRHGAATDCEGYGSVESTEGDYAGGICGESLSVIKRCYALCSVSGGKNVGGIAGSADTLKDCYAVADCSGTSGRIGAIAGQSVHYGQALDEGEVKVSGNYYVGDRLYGINNISYAGVAEPVSYEELLKAENLPSRFCHLKVIFRVDGIDLGTQEVPYGESLSVLNYPQIPKKEGYYGVWPDYSSRVMEGNLLVTGEYKKDVTVVQSNRAQPKGSAKDNSLQGRAVPYALAKQRFTEDTVLKVAISDAQPPQEAGGREHMLYDVMLEQAGIGDTDTFAIRLYNPYGKAAVYGYQNGAWAKLESKARGSYLQVDMSGKEATFCVAKEQASGMWMAIAIAGGTAVLAALFLKGKKRR